MIEKNRIYNESCLDTLKRMEDKEVDVVITSPPYNMNLRIRNGKYCSRQITEEFSTKYAGFNDNLPIDEYNSFHTEVLKELLRVSHLVFYNIQIVTGSKRSVFKMIGEFSEQLKDIVVWDKGWGQPAMQVGVMNRQSELVLIFADSNAISRQFRSFCHFDRGTLSDVWHIKRGRTKDSKNKAVMPNELVEKILLNFTDKGDVVYDPFCGTGTTAFVANQLGRLYVGSEISSELIATANGRLREVQKPLL